MLEKIITLLSGIITSVISSIGYPGIFILMALESMTTPIPSELVMPFAGYLAATGKLNLYLIILFGAFGCLAGSLLSYYGGSAFKPLILRYGNYILVSRHDLELTEQLFSRHGEKVIFISRFIPVVRHLISIPAGISRMNLVKFSAYTFFGSLLWVTAITSAGFFLGTQWDSVYRIIKPFEWVVMLVIVAAVAWYVYRHFRHIRAR